jgi:UDP-glucose 4-epimerase
MRILVTGGGGFIGGRISQHLHQNGFEVIIGTRNPNIVIANPFGLKVVRTDWNNPIELESICFGIDLIIHTAGLNANDCKADTKLAIKINGFAVSMLINAAKKQGIKKMIHFSTAHVYSSLLHGHISEEVFPSNQHPYSTSNLIGEGFVLSANLESDFHGIVIRLSNGFGVPISNSVNCWMLLVNDLCRQAVEIGKLNLNSSGMQYRNFITLSKICKTIESIIHKFEVNDLNKSNGSLYNLGGDNSLTIFEMSKLVQSRCKLIFYI